MAKNKKIDRIIQEIEAYIQEKNLFFIKEIIDNTYVFKLKNKKKPKIKSLNV